MNNASRLFGLKGAAVKAKLARKEPIVGYWLWFPYPLIGEMVSRFDFDVLLLDMEHGPWDIASVTQLLTATAGSPAAIMARLGGIDQMQIQLLLDLGLDGLVVAHCDDLDTVRRAVAASKYPPIGQRGIVPIRAGAYLEDIPGYLRRANDSVMFWLQLEKEIPERELMEMLQLPGVDGLMLGPCDLANSMGHLTDWDHPEVLTAVEQAVNVARKIGKPFLVPGKRYEGQLIHLLASDVVALRRGIIMDLDEWKARQKIERPLVKEERHGKEKTFYEVKANEAAARVATR